MKTESPASESQWDFPYHFTADGRLCHNVTLEAYVFPFSPSDVQGTQKQHLALCQYTSQHVCSLLEEQLLLHRVHLPPATSDGPQSRGFVYMSGGAMEDDGTLLVLIQDWGTAPCGVWSWMAVTRAGLEIGSQIPYVRRALAKACSVLLLNPNGGGRGPEEHVHLVWDHLVAGSNAERVAVVAHGYGGLAFVDLLCRRPEEVRRRVWAVAFLDSSHNLWHQPLGTSGRDWLKTHSRSWVVSAKPLNRSVGSLRTGCPQMSAGTQSHEMAPSVCMESVFRFFAKLMSPKAPPTPFDIITRSRSQSKLCDIITSNHDDNNNTV